MSNFKPFHIFWYMPNILAIMSLFLDGSVMAETSGMCL